MIKQQLTPRATKAGNDAQKHMQALQKAMQQLTQQHNKLTAAAQQVDIKGSKGQGDDLLRTTDLVKRTLEQYELAVKNLVLGVQETKKEQEKQKHDGLKKPGVRP